MRLTLQEGGEEMFCLYLELEHPHVQSRRWTVGVGGRERRAELLAGDEGRAAGDLAHLPSRAAAAAAGGGAFRPAARRRLAALQLVPLDHAAQRVGTLQQVSLFSTS